MNKRAQTSLEYLLLIAGAITIAAIVIYIVMINVQTTGSQIGQTTQTQSICQQKCIACANDFKNCTIKCTNSPDPAAFDITAAGLNC